MDHKRPIFSTPKFVGLPHFYIAHSELAKGLLCSKQIAFRKKHEVSTSHSLYEIILNYVSKKSRNLRKDYDDSCNAEDDEDEVIAEVEEES